MKKPVTFRLDQELLDKARRSARADNRTLTNFVETVLKAQVERAATQAAAPAPDPDLRNIGKTTRTAK